MNVHALLGPSIDVPGATLARQRTAHDPSASAWVRANAGAGKTHVLSRRVMRLLLSGAEPSKILCLTYTKAAAAEMATRVFGELAKWAVADEAALAAEIEGLEDATPSSAKIAEARRLFARALETPGGLKIETLHGFCQRLLHLFPLEANVPGHFEVIETGEAAELVKALMVEVLAESLSGESPHLKPAYDRLTAHYADDALREALHDCLGRRQAIERWLASCASENSTDALAAAVEALYAAFGLEPGCSEASLLADYKAKAVVPYEMLREWHAAHLDLSTGVAMRDALACLLEAVGTEDETEALLDVFLKQDRQPRAPGKALVKAFKSQVPDAPDLFEAGAAQALDLHHHLTALESIRMTEALLRVSREVWTRYARAKAERGRLDYDDLIERTAALLTESDVAQWVLFKLDRGLDHILVDEAQDTSPEQWRIVAALASDFFSGEGAREGATRTVFAVGDEKQSIYSFQGAQPALFPIVGTQFRRLAGDAGETMHADVRLHSSFRSHANILRAVDRVFDGGLLGEDVEIAHEALPEKRGGVVEIWPPVVHETATEVEDQDWTEPVDAPTAAEVRLADDIAEEVRALIEETERLPSGKPLIPASVMILTRTRGTFAGAMNKALKARGVPVAGADRLPLLGHIAVRDLLALASFVLLPEDDLTLATLLKSPLVGFDEDELFSLAHGRPGTLWRALRESDDERRGAAAERLAAWLAMADRVPPFAFYARVLGRDGGRRALMARLGGEVEEVIDAFMGLVETYESSSTPSLQGLLAHVSRLSDELKREPDAHRSEVRVMTVHGAKGLEADLVFLVDPGTPIVSTRLSPPLMELPGEAPGAPPALLWRPAGVGRTPLHKRVEEQEERNATLEYRRLLYVGMTRARERLTVCGIEKRNSPDEGWSTLVRRALEEGSETLVGADGRERLRWPAGAVVAGPAADARKPDGPADEALPPWLRETAPPIDPPPRPLRPSARIEEGPGRSPLDDVLASALDAAPALDRGTAIHRMLQSLPDLPRDKREAAALRYLGARHSAYAQDHAALAREAMAILDDPRLAPIFAPGGQAEVAVAGEVEVKGRKFAVTGQIDRLRVVPERVLVVDYKTNRSVPETPDRVDPAYLRQLALYRALMRRLHPDRPCECALLWTAAPSLMTIPDALLDASLG